MEKLDGETQILARPYSLLRRRQNKWKLRTPEDTTETVKIGQDLFSFSELKVRTGLKRSEKLFCKILRLWKLVNPFSYAGISRTVYFTVLKFMYKTLFKLHLGDVILDGFAAKDMEIDFKGEICMQFSDFYDAVFDVIDQLTMGKAGSEYVGAINGLIDLLSGSEMFETLNLHSKAHCAGKRPRYHYWMKEFMQTKLESASPGKQPRRMHSLPRLKCASGSHLAQISPLSTHKKSGFVNSYLLEEIIEGRNRFLKLYTDGTKKVKSKALQDDLIFKRV